MFSKYERRIDTRSYGDKKELFDGVSSSDWDFIMFSFPALVGMPDSYRYYSASLHL